MYGRTTARAIRDDGGEGIDSSVKRCVPCVAGVMGDRLETMDALVVVATEKPFDPTVFRNAIIADAAKCSKVVLVSKHGASKAAGGGGGGGGFLAGLLGGGGDTAAMGESEKGIRACCEERGIGLSIVRVGALKGGGPGFVENGVAQVGLNTRAPAPTPACENVRHHCRCSFLTTTTTAAAAVARVTGASISTGTVPRPLFGIVYTFELCDA